jgi:hypothetical protein
MEVKLDRPRNYFFDEVPGMRRRRNGIKSGCSRINKSILKFGIITRAWMMRTIGPEPIGHKIR